MQTGQIIARLRIQASLSQEELADKLYVSRHLVSKWETDKRRPDYKTVTKMAEIFGVEPEEIMGKNDLLFEELSGIIPQRFDSDINGFTAALNDFLTSVSDRDRRIFIRRYYHMEDTSEIAANYGISEGYVRTVLMRTRKKLKKYFKEADHEKE